MAEPATRKRRQPPAPRPAPRADVQVPRAWSAGLALAFLAFFLAVAPHATGDGDAAELTLALVTRGVVHPPGYPVWTLLGSTLVALLRALGVGYAYAVNATASIGAAVALFLLHRLSLALLPPAVGRGARFALASVPVALLGFEPQWVVASTVVEVHAWHVAWLCATALVFAQLVRDGDAATPRRMFAWGALVGLGLAHHTTSVLFAGPMVLALAFALARARRLRAALVGASLVGAALPLLSYAWVLVRAQHPGTASIWPTLEPTWRGLVDHATGRLYRAFLGGWHPDRRQAAALLHDVYPVLWPALVLAIVGVVRARTSAERLVRGTLVVGACVQLAFVYRYGVADPAAYFLPPLAIALPAVAEVAWPLVAHVRAAARTRDAFAIAAVAFVALGAWGIHAGIANRDRIAQEDRVLRSMWQAVPDRPSIFLWPADPYYMAKVYQQLDGDKPQVAVVNSLMLCNSPREAARFRHTYGFDPLANNGPEHASDVVPHEYMTDSTTVVDPRYVGRVNMTIADSARVPVLLFDDVNLKLSVLGRTHVISRN